MASVNDNPLRFVLAGCKEQRSLALGLIFFMIWPLFWVPDYYFRDFRALYTAGFIVKSNPGSLYSIDLQRQVENEQINKNDQMLPFYHPSYEALIFAPLTVRDYKTAYNIFHFVNALILGWLIFGFGGLFSRSPGAPWIMLLYLSMIPMLGCISQGQDTLIALLLFVVSWDQAEQGKDRNAGILLALALFKFQVAIPMAILLTIRKGKKFAAGFAGGALGVVILSFLLVGPAGVRDFVKLLRAASLADNIDGNTQQIIGVWPLDMANINGMVYAAGWKYLSAHAVFLIVTALSLGILIACAWTVRQKIDNRVVYAIAVLAGVLVSDHLCIHDVALLALPVALVGQGHRRIVASIWLLTLSIFLLAVILRNGFHPFCLLAIPISLFLMAICLRARKMATLETQQVGQATAA
jgi:Glycosyltransferase family 87